MGVDLHSDIFLLICCITFFSVVRFSAGNNNAADENNLQYKEYWYKTEQLCPDLQEAIAGKDIDTANLPYKSVFRFMDHLQSVSEPYTVRSPTNGEVHIYEDLPCILEANGPQRMLSMALIEAIHVDSRPWNYSGAQQCEEHIKLRLPEPTFLKRSNVPKIICRIPKSKISPKEVTTGSLYHPYIWQFQKGKLGLSFSSFNLSNVQHHNGTLNVVPPRNNSHGGDEDGSSFWLEPDVNGNQFVQIVFTTRFAGICTVRVQQYLIDSEKTRCEGAKQRNSFRLCGMYDCSEKENILKTLGFWRHRKDHEKLDILLQAVPPWRRDEPTYLEILVSTLRALIMPLLFLSVFYVTRRLRLKLASRQASRSGLDRHRNVLRQRQCYLRSLIRDGNNTSSTESADMLLPSLILNHVVYDIPVNDYPTYDDLPPPPYESIVQPPSYNEAIRTVKSNRSPSPPRSNPSSPTDPPQETNPDISNPTSSDPIIPPSSPHPVVPEGEQEPIDETTAHLIPSPPSTSHLPT